MYSNDNEAVVTRDDIDWVVRRCHSLGDANSISCVEHGHPLSKEEIFYTLD